MTRAACGLASIPSLSRQWVDLLFRLFWVSVRAPVAVPEICVPLHGQAWMVNNFWVYRPPLSQCSSVDRSMGQQCGNTCPDQAQQHQSEQPPTSRGSGSVRELWSPSMALPAQMQICSTLHTSVAWGYKLNHEFHSLFSQDPHWFLWMFYASEKELLSCSWTIKFIFLSC